MTSRRPNGQPNRNQRNNNKNLKKFWSREEECVAQKKITENENYKIKL